ncbi:hypothetical protein PspS35_14415 [Pseudomonas sp. S35]|uniref:hypothetical protein n=1 Tax=Pseudomonas sp. S35 TaxID=1573719 RepID=UPI00132EB5AB|nr:hypothetical protein [Pseudomonas sp. S35]QHF44911.1 hypothetical protein PspS35_14415 [Pseudomonas sp. S35]
MSNVATSPPGLTAELGDLYIPRLHPAAAGDVGVDGNLGLRNIETPQVVYVKTGARTSPGQLLELFSNDPIRPVAHTFVMAADTQREWLPILLPAASIRPEWIDPLVCRINSSGASTLPLRLRVDFNRPGGHDPDPSRPGHQGLVIYLPDDVLVNGVSETRARQNIEITLMPYSYAAPGDQVLLCWGDQQVTHLVTEADLNREINLTVSYAKVMAARDGLELNVRLQVRGHTGNFTDPAERWSAASKVLVYAQRDVLREPYSAEVDPQTGVIDLEKLAGKSVTVSVFASADYFETRDTLEFVFKATDAQGNIVIHSEERPVDRVNAIYDFQIPPAFMEGLAQGHAKLYYTLHKYIGSTTMYSQSVYVSVQGASVQWPEPYVIDTMPFAEIRAVPVDGQAYVPYQTSWKPWDLITLVWLLPDRDGTVEYRFSRSVGERPEHNVIELELPAAQIKRFEGRPSQMHYEVNGTDGRLLGESARKSLLIGEPWEAMIAPVVEKVAGHHLDPDLVPDGVWVTIPNPPVGQHIRLHWFGPLNRIVMLMHISTPGDARIKVPGKYVSDNLNRIVKVYWEVNHNGVPQRYSGVVTLQIARRGIFGFEDIR